MTLNKDAANCSLVQINLKLISQGTKKKKALCWRSSGIREFGIQMYKLRTCLKMAVQYD